MAIFSTLRRFVIGGGLGNRLTSASTPLTVPPPPPSSAPPPRLSQLLARVGIRHGSGGGAGASGHGRKMVVKLTDFEKRRVWDEFHYMWCLCTVPFIVLVLYANIFVGSATLTEIPEGYEPEHWEYYKHPITRGWAWLLEHPEPVDYEIKMSKLYQEILWDEKIQWEKKVKELMRDRQDYKAWYFLPMPIETIEKTYGAQRDKGREKSGSTSGLGERGGMRLGILGDV